MLTSRLDLSSLAVTSLEAATTLLPLTRLMVEPGATWPKKGDASLIVSIVSPWSDADTFMPSGSDSCERLKHTTCTPAASISWF